MNINTSSVSENPKKMPWYKVPILWLMIFLLGFTVVSGIYLFLLAHDNNDSIVTESGYVPLNKKQAIPYNSDTKKN